MTAVGERIGRSTNLAFATPWEVCFNVAYPPPSKLKNTNITQGEDHPRAGDYSQLYLEAVARGLDEEGVELDRSAYRFRC